MTVRVTPQTVERNVAALFSAKAVERGGVVRRCRLWADDQIGRDRLIAEVRARGFHMIRCGEQYVVICNRGLMEVIC